MICVALNISLPAGIHIEWQVILIMAMMSYAYASRIFLISILESISATCTVLCIESVNALSTSNDLMILKSPLPVLARIDDNVTFCEKVYPTNVAATWFVRGYRTEEDKSDEFTISL
uniref:Uncharacterized protein n=1 Tax=Glossina brevipalpis TaxID=37001 RepID=A0A1A9WZ01_9MUSC